MVETNEERLERQKKQAETMRRVRDEKQADASAKKDSLEGLLKKVEKLEKDRDLLLSVADKRALAMHYQRNQGDVPKNIKLRQIDGKVIIGWRNVKDDVYDTGNNKWVEDQQTELLFEDKSSKIMRIKDFERLHKKVMCERLEVINGEKGDISFKVKRKDTGKVYVINACFVN